MQDPHTSLTETETVLLRLLGNSEKQIECIKTSILSLESWKKENNDPELDKALEKKIAFEGEQLLTFQKFVEDIQSQMLPEIRFAIEAIKKFGDMSVALRLFEENLQSSEKAYQKMNTDLSKYI